MGRIKEQGWVYEICKAADEEAGYVIEVHVAIAQRLQELLVQLERVVRFFFVTLQGKKKKKRRKKHDMWTFFSSSGVEWE